ncbi:MAG TPA: hypothetical protein VIV11_20715 [Kofleriaceae bacterium]
MICASACGRERSEAASGHAEAPAAAPRVDASELIVKLECNRCHEVAAVAPAPRDKHCVACHQEIHAGTYERGDVETQQRWRTHITSMRFAPSLANADRLRRSWVREFLLAPHDVRPGLVAQMPRLAIVRADAERLAAHLAPDTADDPPPAMRDVERGELLYRGLACGRCHRFTGATVDDAALHVAGRAATQALQSWELAPDLRHARVRMTTASLAEWIAAPRGAMPMLGVAPADARALAAFIAGTSLVAPAPRVAPQRLPVLEREVTWDEVEAKVFRKVCWHCHATPELARGDGGPGNSGGFGFSPRGLDLSSYAGISAGSLDDAGERRSVFAKLADGTPRIVAHLYARYVEDAGSVVDGVRGMPLGLPPMSLEAIQLVETWIAQGRPR